MEKDGLMPEPRFEVVRDCSVTLRKTEKRLREISHELRVRLRDVSSKGLCIILSYNNRHFFKVGDQIWITAMNQEKLSRPFLGIICYITRTSKTRFGDVQVGVSLQKELPVSLQRSLVGKKDSLVA